MKAEPRIGPKVVVARSKAGNSELSAKLRAVGASPVEVDTVELSEPSDWAKVDGALSNIGSYDWVVLTSPLGASLFARRLRKLKMRPKQILPRIAAVGEMTARSLRNEGLEASFVPTEYTTSALGRQLPRGLGDRTLLMRADRASRSLVRELEKRGFSVTSVPIYRTRAVVGGYRGPTLDDAAAVLLGSPSEVEGLVSRLPRATLESLRSGALAMCIGPVTAKSARKAGFKRILVPSVHTFNALLMEVRRSVVR